MRSDNPSWFSWPFARLWNRSAPNADRPVYIVGPDTSQPQPNNIDVAIAPRGFGAIVAQIPDGTTANGNKRGDNAVDLQIQRGQATHVASGARAVIVGGSSNTASGGDSIIVGGSGNSVSGTSSFLGGGTSNTANGSYATTGGGLGNSAGASFASVLGGDSNTASGASSVVGGGSGNTANGTNSVVPGGASGSARGLTGRLSFGAGSFGVSGDAQYGLMVLRRSTTDNTPSAITATNAATSSVNIPILPNTSLYAFRGQVTCIQTAGSAGTVNDCKAWDIVGAIKRNATAASTALLGTPTITVLGADTNLGADNTTGAIIAITADTTNGGLLITVTGETNKTLRWVATVHTTEVDY